MNVPVLLDKETLGKNNGLDNAEHYGFGIKDNQFFDNYCWNRNGVNVAKNWDEAYENHVRWYYETFSKLGQVLK